MDPATPFYHEDSGREEGVYLKKVSKELKDAIYL